MRDDFVSIDVPPWAWVALIGVIVVLLVADLLIVHRRPHAIGFREAAIESSVWIALGPVVHGGRRDRVGWRRRR